MPTKKKKTKSLLQKVRISLPKKTGGSHRPKKGGGYNRNRENKKTRDEVNAESN